jgi:hypothetical protein
MTASFSSIVSVNRLSAMSNRLQVSPFGAQPSGVLCSSSLLGSPATKGRPMWGTKSKVILEQSTRAGSIGPGRTQSEFGVATCQGFFAVVTRFKVEFAAEAAHFEFGSDFGRSHLVSRRSSGNPVKDSLSGIVWFLHGFVLQPREARGLQVRRSPAAPAQGCWKTGSVARWPLRHSGPRPHRIDPV